MTDAGAGAPPAAGAEPVFGDGARLAVGFSRALRHNGLRVPPSATLSFAQSLALVGVDRPAQ